MSIEHAKFRKLSPHEASLYFPEPKVIPNNPTRSLINSAVLAEVKPKTPLQLYLEEVELYPRLNIYQEQTLFRCLREERSIADLREDEAFGDALVDEVDHRYRYAFERSGTLEELIFRCNLDLVVREAMRYPISTLDLIQEGNLGLVRAIQRHDPDLGRLEAYARWWIKGAMFAAMPDIIRPVHIPKAMLQQIKGIRRMYTELQSSLERDPSEDELRKALQARADVSDATIATALELIHSGVMHPTSFDKAITPDNDSSLYDFIEDDNVDVQQEALRKVENEEYRTRPRPSAGETAKNMGVSIPTAHRALRRLVETGLLPLHPKDPRTVDETGYTQHTRMLDAMVEEIIMEDPSLRNKEVVTLLAAPDKLGKRVSILTVARARLRLASAGKTERRVLPISEYRKLDDHVEGLLKKGLTYKQIAEELNQPIRRVTSAGHRLRGAYRAESRAKSPDTRTAVKKYLDEYQGVKINFSEIARKLGVTRERIRQIYDQLNS
ncbi:hypothetical protein HY025_06265 [Candidatus Daviesbacteria bacterium]|nr:hypothetical protein [Candidatus Daviesbacteria bacterium]